jgi:hypothetical protein
LDREEDKEAMVNSMGIESELKGSLGKLDEGEAFIRINRKSFKGTFLAKIEPIELNGKQIFTGDFREESIQDYMEEFYKKYPMEEKERREVTIREYSEILDNERWINSLRRKMERLTRMEIEIIRLLAHGHACKASDFKEHFKADGTSIRTALINLAKNGLIGFKSARAKGNPIFYFLRPEAEVIFYLLEGATPDEARAKSIQTKAEHGRIKEGVIRIFEEQGWKLAGNKAKNGFIDLCFQKGDARVPIEIETGSNKSEQVYKNIRKCVDAYGEAYFIVPNQIAYNTIMQQCAKLKFDNPSLKFNLNIIYFEGLRKGENFERISF